MPMPTDHEKFDLGDVVLQRGATLRGAQLAYTTYGTLNADKSNVIVRRRALHRPEALPGCSWR